MGFFLQTMIIFWIISIFSFATANSMLTGSVSYTSEPVQSVYVTPSIEPSGPPYEVAKIDILQFLISFLIATLLMLLFLKLFKGNLLFEIFFSGAIIFGAQGPLGILFDKIEAFFIAIGIVILRFVHPRIWTQNIAIIAGIAGISASLGMSVKPAMAITLLILLSIYDIIAVYKTRHMTKLFKGMAKRGVVLALVIPNKLSLWLNRFDITKPENKDEYIFLGTGDLALPLFFAVSTFSSGAVYFVSIVLGATVGFLADHIFFVTQKERKPIPALPLVALFSILGYIIASYSFVH